MGDAGLPGFDSRPGIPGIYKITDNFYILTIF